MHLAGSASGRNRPQGRARHAVIASWGAIASEVHESPLATHSEALTQSWMGPADVDGQVPTKHPVRRSISAQQMRPAGQSETLRHGSGIPPLDEKIDGEPLELVEPP